MKVIGSNGSSCRMNKSAMLFLVLLYYCLATLSCVSSSSSPSGGSGLYGYNSNLYYSEQQQQYNDYQEEQTQEPGADVATPSPLPEGWFEATDPATGFKYYYNKEQNITQWERPTAVEPATTTETATATTSEQQEQLDDSYMPLSAEEPVEQHSPLSTPTGTNSTDMVAAHENHHHHYAPPIIHTQDVDMGDLSLSAASFDDIGRVTNIEKEQHQQQYPSSLQPSLYNQPLTSAEQHHHQQQSRDIAAQQPPQPTRTTDAHTIDTVTGSHSQTAQQPHQQQYYQRQQLPPSDTDSSADIPDAAGPARLPFGQPPFLTQSRHYSQWQQQQIPASIQQQQPQPVPPQSPQHHPHQPILPQQQPFQQQGSTQQSQQLQELPQSPQQPWQQQQQRQSPLANQPGPQQLPHHSVYQQQTQQQQQQHPGYYANPQQDGYYGQQQQHPPNQLIPLSSSPGMVKEALGTAWQTVLGFGKKAQEAAVTTSEKVASGASMAGETLTSTGAGLWTKAKTSIEQVSKSLFEDDASTSPQHQQYPQQGYSLSQYGVPSPGAMPGSCGPPQPQQHFGQSGGPFYGQQQQQQQQQQTPYYATSQQQQRGGAPQRVAGMMPRGDVAYPHQQHPQSHGAGTALQHTQWEARSPIGEGVPPESAAVRQRQQSQQHGVRTQQQQQYYNPYGSGGPSPPQQQQYPQQQQQYPQQQQQSPPPPQHQQQQQQEKKDIDSTHRQDPWLINDY